MKRYFQPLLQPGLNFLRVQSLHSFSFPCKGLSTSSPNPLVDSRLPPRWLSDIKARIGKCIIFGLQSKQIDEAGEILRVIARDWRELLAGSEGYLTGQGRAGLERHNVVWGEMVGRS